MILFDIFTAKKSFEKVFNKENVSEVLDLARDAIIGQIKDTYPGTEKMAIVNALIVHKIERITADVTNGFVRWTVERIKSVVPVVTQAVYNFLKEKVENL